MDSVKASAKSERHLLEALRKAKWCDPQERLGPKIIRTFCAKEIPLTDPFSDKGQHLLPLPDHILLDIARNEAAQDDYRKLAVEILINRKSPKVRHPDLYVLVDILKAELDLTEIPVELPASGPGPLQASVTTATVFGSDNFVAHGEDIKEEILDEVMKLASPVQKMDKPKKPKKEQNAAPLE